MVKGADLPAGVKPSERDAALIGEDTWNIVKVSSVPIGNVDLVFTLSINRA